MAHTGVSDPGHGGFDPGACGNGLRECDLTWKFGTKFATIMERCGVKMFFTREQNSTATNNKNAELGYRCKLANQKGVSFYIAFHINAGGGTGFESYRYTGNDAATVRLQQLVHRNVSPIFSANGMPDRGMKTADFAVLRGTNMPAILLELGFIDNARDAKYISTDDFQNKVAEAVAKAVCEWLGVAYVGETPSPTFKEIPATVNGAAIKAITDGNNTHLIWDFLAGLGLREGKEFSYEFPTKDTVKFEVLGQDVPAVICKGDSYLQWNKIPGMQEPKQRTDGGFDFTMPKFTPPAPSPAPAQQAEPQSTGTPILGESAATIEKLLGHALSINPEFPQSLPALYLEIGKRYGIKGDIAFAQMLLETNYFRFGKDVQPSQNNFAGLGATGGVAGATFATPADGVRAHLQHLFAYCSTTGLPAGEPLVDPRFALVCRGSATTWEWLNGHWAVPGTTYGQDILAIHQKITAFDPMEAVIKKLVDKGIINTPEYWTQLLAGQEQFNPEYFKTLIARVAEKL